MKIIHFIWLGKKELHFKYLQNIAACNDLNPDYQVSIWQDDHKIELLNKDIYLKERHPAGQADLLRLEVLYQFGGIYSDCDIRWHNPMDFLKLNPNKVTLVQESGPVINNAFMSAPKEHPIILEMINRCKNRLHLNVLPARFGPGLMMDIYHDYPNDIDVVSNRLICSKINAGPDGILIRDKVAYHGYDNGWFS
jgi:mannosyltransferase OCH1-like enzyme